MADGLHVFRWGPPMLLRIKVHYGSPSGDFDVTNQLGTHFVGRFFFGGSFGTHELPEEANGRWEIVLLLVIAIILWFWGLGLQVAMMIHV